MKNLLLTLVIFGIASLFSSVHASVLFQEDFEGGTAGNDIAGATWTKTGGSGTMNYSSTTIDQGQSVESNGFTFYTHTFASPIDSTGLDLTLISVMDKGTSGAVAARFRSGGLEYGFAYHNDGLEWFSGTLNGRNNGNMPQLTGVVDTKMEVVGNDTTFSYRMHGDTNWIVLDTLVGIRPTGNIDAFKIQNASFSGDGYIDSIELTGTAAVPEPATMALMGLGLGGMALARRKRKATA